MQSEQTWAGARSLMCTRLDSLGELLMTTPALRALKEGRPDRKITLLTTLSAAQAAPMLDMVDEVIFHETPFPGDSSLKADEPLVRRLRRGGFDGAVMFSNFQDDPLPAARLASLARIPLRLGQSREDPPGLFTDHVRELDHIDQPTLRHEVRRQLDLVRAIGCFTSDEHLSLNVPPEAVGTAASRIYETGLDMNRRWLVVHPGVSEPSRRYPGRYFAQAAAELSALHGFQVLFTGSQSETALVEAIRSEMEPESFSLAGRLDLETLSAVIFLAPLLISNNNAPVHIAAALQTPVVDLYALTHPQQTPWKVAHRTLYFDVPCKFCYSGVCPLRHHNCLERVPPGAVVRAVLELLKESRNMEELRRLSSLSIF